MILRAFLFFWHLLWLLMMPLVLVYLWHRGRRDADYKAYLGERFGRYGPLPQNPVWIHAVSLGEMRSAVPLARGLLDRGETLVLTHFTPAGRREAHKVFAAEIAAGRVASVWVPLDMGWVFRRFFAACRPKLGLTMEIEIWPAMVMAARAGGVPLYMCNAQYPHTSIARDNRGLRIRQRIMGQFAGAFVKSQLQADRFGAAGVPNIHITGELRFDQPIPPALLDAAEVARPMLNSRPTVTIASAIEGEDGLFIDTIKAVLEAAPGTLFVYVPRAPERFDEVADMLKDAGLHVARRSVMFDEGLAPQTTLTDDTQILLGDSMGEMYFYLSLAARVVVGGGFHPKGAHNVIEPLALQKPVITGSYIQTIEYPFREAEAAGVALSVPDAPALCAALTGPDWTTPAEMQAFFAAHAGATGKTLTAISDELAGRARAKVSKRL